jgi:hypothetical protein
MRNIGILKFLAAVLLSSTMFMSCADEHEAGKGTLSLSITDAPTDAANVSGVYITITGVEYRREGNSWEAVEPFGDPYTVNLLELTEGKSDLLGDFSLEAGTYDGLRFKLDASENGGAVNNEATYIEFTDGSREPLFVPSGTQSGYKALGSFTVPLNGSVAVTADFDVRKSVVEAGASGKYLLKPTIRLVVNNQAGSIAGSATVDVDAADYVVFVYEEGSWSDTETAAPAEGETRFANAVSSAKLREDGTFVVPFLAPATYQLIVASFEEGNFKQVEYVHPEGVEVQSLKETLVELVF